MIDGLQMNTGEVVRIETDGRAVLLCRQSDSEWTLSSDRWGSGVRQLTATITLSDNSGATLWQVVALPGNRNPREVQTWSVAIHAALTIR